MRRCCPRRHGATRRSRPPQRSASSAYRSFPSGTSIPLTCCCPADPLCGDCQHERLRSSPIWGRSAGASVEDEAHRRGPDRSDFWRAGAANHRACWSFNPCWSARAQRCRRAAGQRAAEASQPHLQSRRTPPYGRGDKDRQATAWGGGARSPRPAIGHTAAPKTGELRPGQAWRPGIAPNLTSWRTARRPGSGRGRQHPPASLRNPPAWTCWRSLKAAAPPRAASPPWPSAGFGTCGANKR